MIIKNNIKLIKSKCFNSVTISVCFPIKITKEELVVAEFLPKLLVRTNGKYKTEDKFVEEQINRYIYNFEFNNQLAGNVLFTNFIITFADPKIIKEDILNSVIDFLYDSIYNPNIINNKFNEETYQNVYNLQKEIYAKINSDAITYAINKMLKIIDNVGYLKSELNVNEEKFNQITNTDVCNFYQKFIKVKPLVTILGNINNNDISYLNNKFKNNPVTINGKYYLPLKSHQSENLIEETNFNQSVLTITYKIKDIKKTDLKYLYVLHCLLSSGTSRLLLNCVRYEKGLCYAIIFRSDLNSGFAYIRTAISKDKEEETLNAINDAFNKLNDENFVNNTLNTIKKGLREDNIRILDNPQNFINNYLNQVTKRDLSNKQKIQIVSKIKYSDLKEFIDNKLVIDLINFNRGTK